MNLKSAIKGGFVKVFELVVEAFIVVTFFVLFNAFIPTFENFSILSKSLLIVRVLGTNLLGVFFPFIHVLFSLLWIYQFSRDEIYLILEGFPDKTSLSFSDLLTTPVMLISVGIAVPITLYATLYYRLGTLTGTCSSWEDAFYFSATTFVTLGYGDVYPEGILERVSASIEGIIGYVFLGLLLIVFVKFFEIVFQKID